MHPQLAEIVDDFERARARLRRLSADTPDERWSARSDPTSWSVAECVAHLNTTSRAFIPVLRAAFAEHPPSPSPPRHYRRDAMGWLVTAFAAPLPRIGGRRIGRMRTRSAFHPSGPLDRDALVDAFERLQDEQVELTKVAEGRPLGTIRIASPFDPRVTYNAYSALRILPRHQHRHLQQAEEVWSRAGAP